MINLYDNLVHSAHRQDYGVTVMQCCECLHSRLLFANLVSKIVTSQPPIQSSDSHSRGQSFLMRNSIVKVQPGWKIFPVETILTRILQVKVVYNYDLLFIYNSP